MKTRNGFVEKFKLFDAEQTDPNGLSVIIIKSAMNVFIPEFSVTSNSGRFLGSITIVWDRIRPSWEQVSNEPIQGNYIVSDMSGNKTATTSLVGAIHSLATNVRGLIGPNSYSQEKVMNEFLRLAELWVIEDERFQE